MRDEHKALDRLSLRVQSGEHLAIIGPNGSGKSTLLKTIFRECYPILEEGASCRIFGKTSWDVSHLRKSLGVVSNDLAASFDRHTAVADIVLTGFFSSLTIEPFHDVTDVQRTQAQRAMQRLGIEHLASRRAGTLSSGEIRRAVIARALVHDPASLIFDEPSTSLDLVAQRDLRSAMRDLAHEGIGIVLVTHLLEEIIPEIERIVLLREGRVVADGPKTMTLTAENLSNLFGQRIDVIRHADDFYRAW